MGPEILYFVTCQQVKPILLVLRPYSEKLLKDTTEGVPWQFSGQDSTRSLPRAQVQSLGGELRSYIPQAPQARPKYFFSDKIKIFQGLKIKPPWQ